MEKISVVISVVKEEIETLPRALSSVKNIASEIVIVDMTSTDTLFEIAGKFNAKIYKHKLVPYVEVVRNFGISKATGDWILILDPDEEISENLAAKLKDSIAKKEADYFRLPRKNIIFGKWIKNSRWWPDYNIRFFRKGYVTWNEVIHSVPLTKGEGTDLEATESSAIIHHHYQSVEQFIGRMNRYTSAQAGNLVRDGYKFKWSDLIKKPSEEFLSRYFQGEGFKDGLHGLVLAILQGVSEFVLYLKTWQKENFKELECEPKKSINLFKEVESDFHYWEADTLLKQNGGLKERIKRKFRLP